MRRRLAVLWTALVITVLGVAVAPHAAAADLPPGQYLWATTTTQTLVWDRSSFPPKLLASFDDRPTGAPVRVVNQGGELVLVPTATGIDLFPQRFPRLIDTYNASPNGYQQVVAARGTYAATIPTVYGLRTGGRVVDVFGPNRAIVTSITLPGPTTYMSAPRPPNGDVIVLGSVKDDTTGAYLNAVIDTSDNSVAYLNEGTDQVANGTVWSPDGSRAYLSSTNLDSSTGSIGVYVPPRGFTNTPMSAGVTPKQVAISTDGSRLYLPAVSAAGNSLRIVDTGTLQTVDSMALGPISTFGVPAFAPDGKLYIPPGADGGDPTVLMIDFRTGGESVLALGGGSPVIGVLVADIPAAVRIANGANQSTYVNTTFVEPAVVTVVDPAGNPLPDQLVRFTTDEDANAEFLGCTICLVYTGPDGRATSPPIIAGRAVGPATVQALLDSGPTVTFPLTVIQAAIPPTVTALTAGDGQVGVAFTPGDDRGISPPTGFTVTATDFTTPANGGQTATGKASPITVTGLTNGDTYTFTVTANTPAGDWTSAPSQRINVGIPASITGTPPPAEVGKSYRFQFTVGGKPVPVVSFDNDATPLPDGLTFDTTTATISGTPTTAGSAFLAFAAVNAVGSMQNTPTLVVKAAATLGGSEPTPTTTTTTTPTTTTTTTSAPSGVSASSSTGVTYASSSRPLAATGTPVDRFVGAAVVLIGLGSGLILLGRRRRSA
jgi:hypothetical protein